MGSEKSKGQQLKQGLQEARTVVNDSNGFLQLVTVRTNKGWDLSVWESSLVCVSTSWFESNIKVESLD